MDLISRQAAIEALDKYFGRIVMRKKRGINKTEMAIALDIDGIVKSLPSAQPERSLRFRIGEICVDESKGFISSGRAVEKIRELLREAERREE